MSATFTKRARALTFAGVATLGLAAVAQVATVATVSAATPVPLTLHQAPPIQNSEFEDAGGEDCPGSPALWGWHFVLTGGDATFTELTVTFETAGVVVKTSDFGPPSDKHAYVYTATDDTLLSATAVASVEDAKDASKVRLVLSHTCDGGGVTSTPSPTPSVTPSETVSPSESVSPSETVSPSESVSPSETVSPTETVSPSESVSPSETVSPTESVSPTETVSPSESVAPTETVSPSESVAPTETVAPTESESPVPSASVSGVKLTNTPSTSATPTVSPTVAGVKQTRGPAVGGSRLPSTGSPAPVALLLLLGFGLVGAGVLATVTGEAQPVVPGGRHRA